MNKGKHYILPEGVKIEEIKQIMYSNGDGFAYKDENLAEYAVAIGSTCDCGKFIEGKFYTTCSDCREKNIIERYNALEEVIWDGETPLCTFIGDDYFFDEEELDDYCEENDIHKSDLMLVVCKPNKAPTFDLNDYCEDAMPEDFSIDDFKSKNTDYTANDIEGIVKNFLEGLGTVSWYGGNKRVKINE